MNRQNHTGPKGLVQLAWTGAAWTGCLLALAAGTPALAQSSGGQLSPADSAAAIKLEQTLLTTIKVNGGLGLTQDIEGRLIYTIDQAQVSCTVSKTALQQLDQARASFTTPQRLAVEEVERSLARCSGTGTAALNGQNLAPVNSGTTLGLAGGSSNYLNGQ